MGFFKPSEVAASELWNRTSGDDYKVFQVGTITALEALLAHASTVPGYWRLHTVLSGFSVGLGKTEMGYTVIFEKP